MNPSESKTTPLGELSTRNRMVRLAVIGLALVGIVGLFAYAGGWLTPKTLTPVTMINTFEKVNGVNSGFRRNHSKGVCVSGYFESNGQGAAISKAAIFQQGRVAVLGRFALAAGQPYVTDAPGIVRSMAILFQLPDGEEWRSGMNSIPVFPVRTAEAFHDLLVASAPDPATGKPDPTKMKAFLTSYPETAKALGLIGSRQISSGFADSAYNSLDAFRFISANGTVSPVRWSMVPVQPFEPIDMTDPAKADKNYLFDALVAAIHNHPLQWRLVLTIGHPEDPTNDATVPWPPDRTEVDAGTLTIDQVQSEDTSPARDINFDPLVLPDGIAGSDDPLLSARSAAYSESFTRRESESKQPSAVSSSETEK